MQLATAVRPRVLCSDEQTCRHCLPFLYVLREATRYAQAKFLNTDFELFVKRKRQQCYDVMVIAEHIKQFSAGLGKLSVPCSSNRSTVYSSGLQ